uniref:Uncharacterized protein n=1 Tax=Trichobilharzia regenti TaxID=157069 RepID=A0AA85IP97_TRIRE|nr:unnamed protein product [Trichobilharzia regenti]
MGNRCICAHSPTLIWLLIQFPKRDGLWRSLQYEPVMSERLQQCIPGLAGHPWLSDACARFAEIAQRSVIPLENIDAVPRETKINECKDEVDCINLKAFHQIFHQFFIDLLLNSACQPDWPNEPINIDRINFHECQLELTKHFHGVDESSLFNIMENLQKLLHKNELTSIQNFFLHLFTLVFFVSYVQHCQKLPPKNFVLSTFELHKNPVTSHIFYDSLLPILLSIPNHRHSEYILHLLKNSTLSDRYTLLSKLCLLECEWPTDSYPVLEFLFSTCLTHLWSLPGVSAKQLFVQFVNKFNSETQRDTDLKKSVKFTNMLVKFLRNYSNNQLSLPFPEESKTILKQLANENSTFLQNTLMNLVC